MAPKLVTPYRISGKRGNNDAADAAAILRGRAATEHAFRARQERRAAVASDGAPRTPGLHHRAHRHTQPHPWPAGRVGVVLPQKAEVVRREAAHHLDDLPGFCKTVIEDLLAEVRHLA
jgi:transposase